MRLARLLSEGRQKLIHEALKFGAVGGINTVVNYVVFNALALTVFATGQLKATVVATIVATISSYLMNRYWTYRDRPKSTVRREYTLFFLFNAAGLLIELGVLALAKYGFGLTSLLALNIAKTAGLVLGTIFRFWSYRTFVFQPATPGVAAEPVTAAVNAATAAVGTTASTTGTAAATASTTTAPTAQAAAAAATPERSETANPVTRRLAPLEAELTDAIGVTLEAELAVEFGASRPHPAAR